MAGDSGEIGSCLEAREVADGDLQRAGSLVSMLEMLEGKWRARIPCGNGLWFS